jgi:hypothetical protein
VKGLALVALAALLPFVAKAEEHQFTNSEALTIRTDSAYLLVRTYDVPGGALRGTEMSAPVLIRTLTKQELEQTAALAASDPDHWKDRIGSNVIEPLADQPYAETNGERFLLVSVEPGTYVVGGVAATNWATKSTGMMVVSLCMGTVAFDAKPGVLTDLGTLLTAPDDEPTTIPELAKLVSGKPRGFGVVPLDVAIRVATPVTQIPEQLKEIPRVVADYRPFDAFPNYVGAPVARLAPIPGILEYDGNGRVIDLPRPSK